MAKYITTFDVWKELGKDAYTKSRAVTLTSAGTNMWQSTKDEWISGSVTLYDDGTEVTSSSYTTDLDDGIVTYTASGVVTADYSYSDVPDSFMQRIVSAAEVETEKETNRVFTLTTGSTEYHDYNDKQVEFFTAQYPINAITSIETNQGTNASVSWTTLTDGLGNDYYAVNDDLADGRVNLIQKFPSVGRDRIKIVYDHGYSDGSIPADVQKLTTLYAVRELVNSAVWKATYTGEKDLVPPTQTSLMQQIMDTKRGLVNQSITSY